MASILYNLQGTEIKIQKDGHILYRMKKIILVLLILTLTSFSLISCGSRGEDVPVGMQVLSNEYVDYNFYIPVDWIAESSAGVLTARRSESVFANISMSAASAEHTSSFDLDEYWDYYTDSFEKSFLYFELSDIEDITLGGFQAIKYFYSAKFTDVDASYMQVICKKDGRFYIFTYTAAPEQFDNFLPDAEKMLEHFSFR